MAEPVGTRQGCSLTLHEQAGVRLPLTEPASSLPAAQNMKRGHPTKEIWLRAKGKQPLLLGGFTMQTVATARSRRHTSENPKVPQQPQQPQTAKEVIAANVQALIEQLEAGHSDALTAYLDAMSRFHNYSFGNILEIARQKPDATQVAGFWKWKELGRFVKKGEKGIRILAPIVGIRRKKDDEASTDPTVINKPVLVGFRSAYVFDVSQTEGAELPAMRQISGDVGDNRDRLVSFIERQGIELVFTERIAPALGISYGGRIAILPGQSEAEEFSTLVHELAHEMLHKAERRTATTKAVRETEAEAVAFVIGKAVGLETGSASADYIQLYHGNASLLAESLEVIQHTSAVILAALQPPTAEETTTENELAEVAA